MMSAWQALRKAALVCSLCSWTLPAGSALNAAERYQLSDEQDDSMDSAEDVSVQPPVEIPSGACSRCGTSGYCGRGCVDRGIGPLPWPAQRHVRAGCPLQVAWYAVPSVNSGYAVGYIGGGAAVGGELRACQADGTFGLDYWGKLFHRRIWLKWWHGRHAQGGTGKYEPDGGPHLIRHH